MSIMDSELENATRAGDVQFLERAVASHDDVYFLGLTNNTWRGNIFHIAAAWPGLVDFFKEALRILPTHINQQLLSSQQHHLYGWNPLHDAAKNGHLEIVRLMLGFYKSYSGPLPDVNKPWLALSKCTAEDNTTKQTPLHFAIKYGHEDCAMEILSMDMELFCGNNMLDEDGNSLLFLAVQKGFNRVAQKILNSDCSYSLSGKDGSNALHVAPATCSGNVIKLLLNKHLDCLDVNVLRKWAKEGSIRLLELLLDEDFSSAARSKFFRDLICMNDVEDSERSPLFLAMMTPNVAFVQALMDFYQQQLSGGETVSEPLACIRPPWKAQSKNGDTPLLVAISSKLEQHALYFLKLDSTLCQISNNEGESPLLVAIDKGCEQVVKEILRIHPNPCSTMLRRKDGVTLLHLLKSCSEETGKQILGKYWWMMNLRDNKGRTALDEARKENVPWLMNLLINPSLIQKEHFDWIKACEKDEPWVVLAFIDTCNDLEEVCRKEIDTPLHHIKLTTYQDYQNFLKIPSIKELKNTTEREGATPLHLALKRKDIHLAKALLVDTNVERNIVDNTGNTALGLLIELCKENDEWEKMCKLIKVNPYLKTTYIQSRTNLDQMRNTLSVVAALLATITFAAGFTLPGGLNSSTGYGMLAKKAPFIVFLLADAYAMCTSMLVLFCLIWSMISDRDMSYFLVDRSVLILMQSLYGTLLAFMTGIYAVIAHESLWAAIIVLVLCSLIGISVNRTVLREIMSKLVPAVVARIFPASKKDDICVELLEEGKPIDSTFGCDDSLVSAISILGRTKR